jgi:peptide chain release factor 2
MKERNYLKTALTSIEDLRKDVDSLSELLGIAYESEDQAIISETESEVKKLHEISKKREIECLFSGETDPNSCFLELHAGAGGTESHDWASMLLRMYSRWAEDHGFKVEVVDMLSGEEAGIKSATLKVIGLNAYGWLKSESGVHRLVRISPFNAAGKRQTSFASAWVFPVIDDSIEIDIKDCDLRIDTFRASGAGGQHVNTTDSAVRITHLPTNIVVQCQNDRSQHKNKDEAFKMLRSRLYEFELKKRLDAANVQNASKTDNGWGNQIRSYVLQPYQMVKDLRTDHEDTDAFAVLDGKIDKFMSAYLKSTIIGKGI